MKKTGTLSFALLSVLLTCLDKEAHLASYFDPVRTDDDKYIQSIRNIQFIYIDQIPAEHKANFISGNKHLADLFELHRQVKESNAHTAEALMEAMKKDLEEQLPQNQ